MDRRALRLCSGKTVAATVISTRPDNQAAGSQAVADANTRRGTTKGGGPRQQLSPPVSIEGVVLGRDGHAHARSELEDARHRHLQLVNLGRGTGDEGADVAAGDVADERALGLVLEELGDDLRLFGGEFRRGLGQARGVPVDRRKGVAPVEVGGVAAGERKHRARVRIP